MKYTFLLPAFKARFFEEVLMGYSNLMIYSRIIGIIQHI